MANNFSGSATRRWDTMMLEEPMSPNRHKTGLNDAQIKIAVHVHRHTDTQNINSLLSSTIKLCFKQHAALYSCKLHIYLTIFMLEVFISLFEI